MRSSASSDLANAHSQKLSDLLEFMHNHADKLRILLYSPVYFPSIGGVETIAVTLATQLVKLGHECTVVTESLLNGAETRDELFPVVRAPSRRCRLKLAKDCSLIHSNGASVAMYPYAVLARRPFMWTHNGYQIQCVDGAGWVDGGPSAVTPFASIKFTVKKFGLLRASKESVKLAWRRFVARRVALNVACTDWVAHRLSAPRIVTGYTPYDLTRFRNANQDSDSEYEFIYVGRLVGEKGISDLLQAFAIHKQDPRFNASRLAIVGDGPLRPEIEAEIKALSLTESVHLLGRKVGDELAMAMLKGRIAIVPSRWEEPMGGVALELLATGRRLIVSKSGGHAECVRDVALTFENGDITSLSKCLEASLLDNEFESRHKRNARAVLERFDERRLTEDYVKLYQRVLS